MSNKRSKLALASAATVIVLLLLQLYTNTFGKLTARILPCEENETRIELNCALSYHIWIMLILSIIGFYLFINWFLSRKKLNTPTSSNIKRSFFEIKDIRTTLKTDLYQRTVNLLISSIGMSYYLLSFEYYYFTSGSINRYKFILLTILLSLFILQTAINKRWLNKLLIFIFLVLLIYVIYTYIYAFYDPYDIVMKGNNGLLIKTGQLIVKSGVICSTIWLMKYLVPKKKVINISIN